MRLPETRYARCGDADVAYQVVGDGPFDLVWVPGWISHLDAMWRDPRIAAFWERLASFSRLILFDKLGTGLSDPIDGVRPLEDRVDELAAVLDAVGSERVALAGFSEGGPLSVLFAAAHPQRTTALVLCDSYATGTLDPGNPGSGRWIAAIEQITEIIENHWGEGLSVRLLDPSNDGPAARRAFGVFERSAASPRMARAEIEMVTKIDVRAALPAVRVPTLILHREAEAIPVEQARYLAEQIPDARLVVTPGADHTAFYGDSATYLDEMERFLTGGQATVRADRVLATVLFTDIVGSTQRAAAIGDAAWRQLLARHDELVRVELDRYRGREIKHTGDGFLATFDGPARAIRCAGSIVDAVGDHGLEVRAGLHTGECEFSDGDVGGMAVHIGARICALAGPSEVLVSSTVEDLVVGSGIRFDDRGLRELKGVPGEWRLRVVSP